MNARSLAITRAVAVIGSTGALILGATFAASVGTVSLTGNTLSAQSGLQIAPDNAGVAGAYDVTLTGFTFPAAVGQDTSGTPSLFWLKNTTGAALTSVTEVSSNFTGFANIDKTKVEVHIKKSSGGADQFDNLSHLNSTGFNLTAPNMPDPTHAGGDQYKVWVTLDSGAISSASDTGTFDLTFTGNQ
jgi:hypothetical protein